MSVLNKSAQILDLVADSGGEPTLTSIASALGQPRSSTHRLLTELVELGLLLRVGANAYAPGPRLARWGHAAEGTDQIIRIAEPAMIRLRDEIGESVHLYVRQRDSRVCVAAVDGTYELRHFTEVGKPLPLSVGASGKLLLAFATLPVRRQEMRRVAAKPLTVRALGVEALESELAEILESEWSTSFGEREEGLAAAAVPIRNHTTEVVAALSVSGPTARLTPERFEAIGPQLKEAAHQISRALGWASAA
jgi:DNA-binding IclR family transcriptional regulator